jgi:hypothetical protein
MLLANNLIERKIKKNVVGRSMWTILSDDFVWGAPENVTQTGSTTIPVWVTFCPIG